MIEPARNEEHEIIFQDDDDDDESVREVPQPQAATSHKNPLCDFSPLAHNTAAAITAANELESFLSSDVETTASHDVSTIASSIQSSIRPTAIQRSGLHSTGSCAEPSRGLLVHKQESTNLAVSKPNNVTSIFDPYASPHRSVAATASLLDISDETTAEESSTTRDVPGSAGFLEMEDEPPRTPVHRSTPHHETSSSLYDPIQTASGLLLTHRRVPPPGPRHSTRFEVEQLGTASKMYRHGTLPSYAYPTRHSNQYHSFSSSAAVFQRYVRLWVILSAVVLLAGTAVLLHHSLGDNNNGSNNNNEADGGYDESGSAAIENNNVIQLDNTNIQLIPYTEEELLAQEIPDTIILLPLPDQGFVDQKHRRLQPLQIESASGERRVGIPAFATDNEPLHHQSQQQEHSLLHPLGHSHHLPPLKNPLSHFRAEFEAWKERHNKTYHSESEHHKRFQIWSHNHERTAVKNELHGPCQLTGKTVFGSNHFQDLTADEFQSQYLTGYHLKKREPVVKGEEPQHYHLPVLGPHIAPERHPAIHDRILKQQYPAVAANYQGGCKWYDISCYLRYFFSTFIYGMGRTMEPAYDANSYPTAVDWRDIGAVTEVHSQGNCGACWAITAVETIESAYFIAKAKLYDLSETEVIVCEESCEMCAGGWPQEAFDYVINHEGLPLEADIPYNGDWLLLLSEAVAGNSDELNGDTVKSYQQQTCPSGGGGGGGGGGNSHSNDKSGDAEEVQGSNTFSRYGKIKGYGYSTDKCVCYTDGSGCDCDQQNEGYAVRNLATYGPAVVCLDASTWQDYTSGIITSESGCSSGFMDVNHCVQAVGYAYMTEDEEKEGNGSGDKNSKSGSGDKEGGSRDSGQRKGYWIVRNQWSKYWGMNGYAYVAMGDNTCGILNDMIQVYS